MFSLLVRRDGLIDPPELGDTDYHCHILPGIDDGPRDMKSATALALRLVEMGVSTVVASPHVISDVYPNTRKSILIKTKQFQREIRQQGIPLTVVPGAEYYCEQSFLKLVEEEPLLSFGAENYVLFESPVDTPVMMKEIVFMLRSSGYVPLLAHVERYRFIQNDFEFAHELKRLGVAFQVNHPSFGLSRNSKSGDLARLLHKKGMIDLFGTDMHRAPQLIASAGKTRPHWFHGRTGFSKFLVPK